MSGKKVVERIFEAALIIGVVYAWIFFYNKGKQEYKPRPKQVITLNSGLKLEVQDTINGAMVCKVIPEKETGRYVVVPITKDSL